MREGVTECRPFYVVSIEATQKLADRAHIPFTKAMDHMEQRALRRAMRSQGTMQLNSKSYRT